MKIDKQEKIKQVEKILEANDIKIAVGGCGCCGSPWFSFEYKGEIVIDDQRECRIDMFNEISEEE